MSLAFLLDEDISYRVAHGLRQRGIDAISVHEVGRANRSISDEEQLTFAAEQGRVMVTYNRADYQALDGLWRIQGRTHAGILWCAERSVPRRAIGQLVRALEAVANERDSLGRTSSPLRIKPMSFCLHPVCQGAGPGRQQDSCLSSPHPPLRVKGSSVYIPARFQARPTHELRWKFGLEGVCMALPRSRDLPSAP